MVIRCEMCSRPASWKAVDLGNAELRDPHSGVVEFGTGIVHITHWCHEHRDEEWHESMEFMERGAMNVEEILKEKSGIKLDIGCGANKQDGFVGMDRRELEEVDIVHDWNDYPWPLPDECVVQAIASHVIEHVNPANEGMLRWMDELWRVCRPDAEVAIAYPHGSSQGFLQDPTHCNPMNEVTWAYFDPLEPNTNGMLYRFYRPKPWRIKHISWNPSANVEVILVKRREDRSYYE